MIIMKSIHSFTFIVCLLLVLLSISLIELEVKGEDTSSSSSESSLIQSNEESEFQPQPTAKPVQPADDQREVPTMSDVNEELQAVGNYMNFLHRLLNKIKSGDPTAVPKGVQQPTEKELNDEIQHLTDYQHYLNRLKEKLAKGESIEKDVSASNSQQQQNQNNSNQVDLNDHYINDKNIHHDQMNDIDMIQSTTDDSHQQHHDLSDFEQNSFETQAVIRSVTRTRPLVGGSVTRTTVRTGPYAPYYPPRVW